MWWVSGVDGDSRGQMPPTAPWIGANFWSRAGGPRMWACYDGGVVRQELETLAQHGLNMTRSFCYWPDFVPEPETLDADVLDRFRDFLDAHADAGLGTVPTFIVGHMSGENWDPSWRQGRDLYSDLWLVSQQAWFAGEIAGRFGDHPAVVGWLVSNEMPLYGGSASRETIASWARLVVQAVRAGGATQPVSLGDGAWGIEVTGVDNGYSLRDLAPLVDFIGPHVYPMQDDQLRQFLTAAFVCELCGDFGKPVVLEEFGLTSDFAAGDHAAAYYRQVLYTTLLAGARGWIAWNNCDYDELSEQDPYRHHAYELHFGLTDRDGRPKPQLKELEAFSKLLARLSVRGWTPVKGEVAIVVPEHYERELPFTNPQFREDVRDGLLQAYAAAREADLPVTFVRERDGLAEGAKLYLAPSTKILTTPGLDRLRRLAEAGATVYLSYFAGSMSRQRGPWLTWLEDIFGVRHRLRYGLVDPIEDEQVTFEFVEPLGDIHPGTVLAFRVAGTASGRAFLPVETAGARVVAVDGHGRAALLRHQLGAGSTIFCTYPLEQMAAATPRVNPEATWQIYSALATEAGVARPVRVEDPRVLTGLLRSGGGETIALFVNWWDELVESVPLLSDGIELDGIDGLLRLEPFAVAAIPCSGPGGHGQGSAVLAAPEGSDARA
jgi:endo-1,4-beta-mannosidase